MKLHRKWDPETNTYTISFVFTKAELVGGGTDRIFESIWSAGKRKDYANFIVTMLKKEEFGDMLRGAGLGGTSFEQQFQNQFRQTAQQQNPFFGFGTNPPPEPPPPPDPEWVKVLGLPKTASKDQITSKYRALAKVHHPDAGGDPKKFAEITKAYKEAIR